ncbi:unnamed protein product [Lactuca saligna]|uniref:Uncharacterized protein n=1 Tax=Lactuca saligna TaxID=75948 RepID=A0AA35ZKD2_LACSI|nr:unnamed protein product [Lactuca saligna]
MTFALITIPNSTLDDLITFLVVGRTPDVMLNLVSPTNKLLIKYKDFMEPTPFGILPKKVTFEAAEGSSKEAKVMKMKKQTVKPKAVEEEVSKKFVSAKLGKGFLRKQGNIFLRESINDGFDMQPEKISKKVTNEVPTPVGVSTPDYPYTKKRKSLKVEQRKKKFKPYHVETHMTHVTTATKDALNGSFHVSLRKDTSAKSMFKETTNPDVNVNISEKTILVDKQSHHSQRRQFSHYPRFRIQVQYGGGQNFKYQ